MKKALFGDLKSEEISIGSNETNERKKQLVCGAATFFNFLLHGCKSRNIFEFENSINT